MAVYPAAVSGSLQSNPGLRRLMSLYLDIVEKLPFQVSLSAGAVQTAGLGSPAVMVDKTIMLSVPAFGLQRILAQPYGLHVLAFRTESDEFGEI